MRGALTILPLLAVLSGCIDIPQTAKRAPFERSTAVLTARPEARQCLSGLGQARASFTPIPDQYYGGGCSTLGTVKLSALQSDQASLALSNLGPVTCPLAQTFAAWARFGVDRAAQQILGSRLAKIETMGSYSCRNVAGSSRRSAHATADAIDISAFVLEDGRRITISGNWNAGTAAERRFLSVIHTSACKRFGTVLGPAYNRAHFDHLHVELGGRAFCR